MRILAIVPSLFDTSPGQRYRIEQWEPFLRERGVEIVFEPFEDDVLHSMLYKPGNVTVKMRHVAKGFSRRASLMRRIKDFDAVYLFREAALLGPPVFERWLSMSGVPYVFDFDDAVFVPYRSPTNGYLSYLKFPGKTRTLCRLAAHVMAGNPYLADYARQVNQNVSIIPTTIDTEKYRVDRPSRETDLPIIGWSGSFSTVQHLDTLRGALQRLARQERFRLRVIGTPKYDLEGVDVEAMPWRAETETQDLGAMDIGVMPLPDDKWSKGKCGLKALQYMALGVPTICSPVGVNTDIIQDGVNGLIADTEDEWVAKMTTLIRSVSLRKQLGESGRLTVEQKYSAIVQAPRVYELFRSVVGAARSETEAA